jgi:nucleotide-binding universal stress UspA family protein
MITIVVPLDGSSLSEGVLPYVENLALRLHAEVYFIQVVDPTPVATMPLAVPISTEQELRNVEGYLSRLASDWQAKDIDTKWELLHGAPATSIVNFARSHKAFMIAMSTHGRSGLSRLVFGSVADRVMREAGIPVLLVRPRERAAYWGPVTASMR